MTFDDFLHEKETEKLVTNLTVAGWDVPAICEAMTELFEQDRLTEDNLHKTLFSEAGWRNILGGITPMADKAAGMLGMGRVAGQGMRRAGMAGADKVRQGYNNAAGAVTDKYNQAAGAVKDKYNQAAGAAGDMYNRAAGAVTDKYNAAKGAVGDAASAVQDKYNAAKGAVGDKFNQATGAVADKYNAAKGAVGDAASALGQGFQQGQQQHQIQVSLNAVQALEQQLAKYGYPLPFLQRALQPLVKAISHDQEQNKLSADHKIGSHIEMTPNDKFRLRRPA